MTVPARITQADMDRAIKAAAKADRARIIMDLANQRIEIIIGESDAPPAAEKWSDDDV